MPAVHLESFKVHNFECDAFGYFTIYNCLRWMQESAFAASAAVGYDFSRYGQIGHLWLVRETRIDSYIPLKYGDEAVIKTWVSDMRRFRSLRAYEVRNARTGVLAARGSTDWVYLNAETLHPAAIPEEMGRAFFPEGLPEESLPRKRFPKPAPSSLNRFSLRRRADWADLDGMWHVNNARYAEYFGNAARQACERVGWPMYRFKEAGLGIFDRSYRIEYRQPALLGDALEITTWISEINDETAWQNFELCAVQDGSLLVQANSNWGVIDLETGHAAPFPGNFLQAIS